MVANRECPVELLDWRKLRMGYRRDFKRQGMGIAAGMDYRQGVGEGDG